MNLARSVALVAAFLAAAPAAAETITFRALSEGCTTRGASLGYHREAADAALKRAIAFLKESFAAVR